MIRNVRSQPLAQSLGLKSKKAGLAGRNYPRKRHFSLIITINYI